MKLLRNIFLLLLVGNIVHACKWCEKWSKIESPKKSTKVSEESTEKKPVEENAGQAEDKEKFPNFTNLDLAALVGDFKEDSNFQPMDIQSLEGLFNEFSSAPKGKQTEQDQEEVSEIGKVYYKKYLAKYYPRALVITDHFFEMCPTAIQAGLKEVVDIVTSSPWFYFQNKPKNFKLGEYWEIVLGQYKTIDKFLSVAMVNREDNTIFPRNDYDFVSHQDDSTVPLARFWSEKGIDSFYDFHAHHCDYHVRMFNEGIQLRNYKQSKRYSRLFSNAVGKLRGSKYESEYQEALKRSKWLLSELARQEGVEDDSDYYGYE